MARDPAVLFYTSDFLTGTRFFDHEQRGQYITLLCDQHQLGHIPENHMVSVCKTKDNPVWKKFSQDEEGLWFNEVMERRIEERRKYCDSRRNNGKMGGRPKGKKSKKKKHMVTHKDTHKGNLPEDGNENEDLSLNDNEDFLKILPETLKTPEFIKSWQEWKDYRKEINKPLKPMAIKKQLKSLSTMGQSRAIAAIDYSITQSYQGIYEQNGNSNKKTTITGQRGKYEKFN